VAVLGVVVWWLMQGTSTKDAKMAETSKSIVADQPKVLSPAPRVEQPLTPPVAPKAKTAEPDPVVATPKPADPRAKLDTAIAEYLRAWESEDYYTFYLEQIPPDEVPAGKTMEELAREAADKVVKSFQLEPQFMMDVRAMELAAYHSIQGQTPILSDDGNTATYESHAVTRLDSFSVKITLLKKNGLWYLDGMSNEADAENDPDVDNGVDANVTPDSNPGVH